MPSLRPVTVPVVAFAAAVVVKPPGVEVIKYPVIPWIAAFGGGAKLTKATESPAVALMLVGIPGLTTVGSVTAVLGAENGPLPCPLLAATSNV